MSTSIITPLEIIPTEILCIIIANVPKKISDWKQLFLVCKDFLAISYQVLKSSPDTIRDQYFVTEPEIVHFNQVFETLLTNAPDIPCPKLATLFRHPLFISQELIHFMVPLLYDAKPWAVKEILKAFVTIKSKVPYQSAADDTCIAWIAAAFGLLEYLKYGIRNMGRSDTDSRHIFMGALETRQPKALEILIANFDVSINSYKSMRNYLSLVSVGTWENKKLCRELIDNQITKLESAKHSKRRRVISSDEE